MDRFNELRLMMSQLLETHKSAGITSASISLGTGTPPNERSLPMTSNTGGESREGSGGGGGGASGAASEGTTQSGLAEGDEPDEVSSTTGGGEETPRTGAAHNRRAR